MIPAAFDFVRADNAEHAIQLLGEHGDESKLMAGGHSLLPMMKLRLAVPAVIIDIDRLDDLRYVRDDGDHISVGALTTHRQVETDGILGQHCPMLAAVAAEVGDPQVRHRGTLGGSLAHSDPASDLPAAVLALDGILVAQGPGGATREIAASDFFTGYFESALADDEMLVEVRVPKTTGGFDYQKFNRRAQDWAIVGAAAVQVNGGVGVSLVNMGSTPVRATAVEAALAGGAGAAEAAEQAAEGLDPPADLNASPEYRRHLARVLTRRALEAAGID